MRFLDRCRAFNLDPFDPASREIHEAAQRADMKAKQRKRYNEEHPQSRWLSTLRRLNEAYEDTARRARHYRDKGGEFLLSSDREQRRIAELGAAELTAAAEQALAAYKAHGAEHPELFDEFELRLELRDLEREAATLAPRVAFEQRMCRTPPPELPQPDTLAQVQAQTALATARAAARTAHADADEAGRFYEALTSATPVDMDACNRARRELERLQTRARKAQGAVDDAQRQVAEAAERDARALAEATAARARHAHHAQLAAALRAELDENEQRQAQIRAALPEPARAPLRRPYSPRKVRTPKTRRAPLVPDHMLARVLTDEIEDYKQQARATDDERRHATLHRKMRAAQRRLAKLQAAGATAPASPTTDNHEDLA
jgi:hypothetical protein